MTAIITRIVSFCIAHRIGVLIGTSLVSLVALFNLAHLRVIIDPAELLPQSHPYVKNRPVLEEIFSEKYAVLISITPLNGDIHDSNFISKINETTHAFRKMSGIVETTLLTPDHPNVKVILGSTGGFQVRPLKKALEDESQFRSWVRLNPILQDTLVSEDGKSLGIIARFDQDPKGYQAILSRIENVINQIWDETAVINMSGHITFLGEIERYSMRLVFLIPLAIIIIGLIHFEAFRSWQGMILPLVTAIMALIWVLGIFGLCRIPLDIFNSTTPILVLAVAAGHAVQILKRYTEEYDHLIKLNPDNPQEANEQAIITALTKVGPLMVAAGFIAAIGFFSLTIFEMGSIKAFGLFTGIGILSALVVELTFIPAMRSFLRPPDENTREIHSTGMWSRVITYIISATQSKFVPWALLIFLIISLTGSAQMAIDNSNKGNFATWTEVRQEDDYINQNFAGTQILYMIVDTTIPGQAVDLPVLQAVDSIQLSLENLAGVGKSVSLVDYLKRMNQAMFDDAYDKFILPENRETVAQYLLLYSSSGTATDLVSFIDDEQQRLVVKIIISDDDTHFVNSLIAHIQNMSASAFPRGTLISFGGGVAEAAAINQVLARDKLLNILQIMTAVFILSALFFRSLTAACYVVTPLIIAVCSIFGILGWTGIPLNIPTSLIAAMSVGIGADYAIYLLARFREEASSNHQSNEMILKVTMGSAGQACLYVATAISSGYGILALSFGFYVHQWMALLIAGAMLVSAFSALILLPRMVFTFKPKFIWEPE